MFRRSSAHPDADHSAASGPGRKQQHRVARVLTGTGDAASGASRVLWIGRAFALLATLCMIGLLYRVADLQHDPPAEVAAEVGSQVSARTLHGRRAALLDRHGRALAQTRIAYRLFADSQLIEDPRAFTEAIGHALGYDPDVLHARILEREPSRYIVLGDRLDEAQAKAARELQLPGLGVEPRPVREYPKASLAGQVVGFVGIDGEGLEGLEARFESTLAGEAGRLVYTRDAQRRPLWVHPQGYTPHRDGEPVTLAIDATIQKIAETELARTVSEYQAEAGQIIILDPHTGEILALANAPAFNPETYRHAHPEQRRNRAVADAFEPGSIFKPFVWARLIEAGLVAPHQVVDATESGVAYFGRRRLRDASPHGEITWDEVLVQSSNIGMARIGHEAGIDTLYEIVTDFGFGQTTGSNLPGEASGIVNPRHAWNRLYSTTSVPMGQEIATTGIQLVRAFTAFANGGLMMTPTIERLSTGRRAEASRVLAPDIARHGRAVLRRAVTEGTGRYANSGIYQIFGKTGTAQRPDFETGGYRPNEYVASFLAGAPLDQPRLVIGCFIHRPNPSRGYYGGLVAAPTARRVLEQALIYLGVPPDADPDHPGPPPLPVSGEQ